MGSIQSKLKDAYIIKKKPILKSNAQKGVAPTMQTKIQNNILQTTTILHRKNSHKKSNNLMQTPSPRTPKSQSFQNQNLPVRYVLEYPYCSVGLISFEIKDQIKYGTGCLISGNIVLTCAHNLYSIKHRQEATNIKFIPAYKVNEEKEYYRAKKIFYPNEFKSNNFDDDNYHEKLFLYDYGIIQLQTQIDLTKQYGCLGYNFDHQDHCDEGKKCILGYTHRQDVPVVLYQLFGKVTFDNKLINHDMPTAIGMSGAPIIDFVKGEYLVIGIHTFVRKMNRQTERSGLRLHQQMFTQIGEWVTQEEEEIDLRDKKIGKEGVKQLSKLGWNTVNSLTLTKNDIGKDGLKYFPRFQWNRLYHLDLGGNNIGPEGVEFLVKANMEQLTSLNLWGNGIGDEGVAYFSQTDWKLLNTLNLYNNEISNQGLRYLVKMKWPELSNLNLGKNKIDIVGVELLLKALWPLIISLNLWGNLIKNEKIAYIMIKEHFTRAKFIYF